MIKLVFNHSDESGILQREIGCLYLQLPPAILFQHLDLQPPAPRQGQSWDNDHARHPAIPLYQPGAVIHIDRGQFV